VDIIIISLNVTCSRREIAKIVHFALNNNHSLTNLVYTLTF